MSEITSKVNFGCLEVFALIYVSRMLYVWYLLSFFFIFFIFNFMQIITLEEVELSLKVGKSHTILETERYTSFPTN